MQPSEIRRRILEDHRRIRAALDSLERSAGAVANGERPLVWPLRVEGEELLDHMHWEDLYLRPALLEADAWGRERASRLDHDHREQRQLLEWALARVTDQIRPPVLLARSLLDLAKLLRADMEHEEAALLDERVLRDDVVGIDVETG